MTPLDRAIATLLPLGGVQTRMVSTRAGEARVLSMAGRGRGHPVCLLHGLGSLSQDYALLMRRLRPHVHAVHAVDLPGHGGSEQLAHHARGDALLDAAMDAIGAATWRPMVLMGNSLGGLMAVHFALRHPGRVHTLVLLSPAGAPLGERVRADLMAHFGGDRRKIAATLERVFDGRRPLHGLMTRTWHQRLTRSGLRKVVDRIHDAPPLNADQLQALRCPTLLLWGARERILPPENLAFFQAHLPDHAVVEQPREWTHAPFVDHLAEVGDLLAAIATGRRELPPPQDALHDAA